MTVPLSDDPDGGGEMGQPKGALIPIRKDVESAANLFLVIGLGGAMRIVSCQNRIGHAELQEMAANMFGDLVKAVVDIKLGIMAVDAELHADEEALLIGNGSDQNDLWGINLYPELTDSDFVEFDSMINLRPSRGNRSRGVEDPEIRERIHAIVSELVTQ